VSHAARHVGNGALGPRVGGQTEPEKVKGEVGPNATMAAFGARGKERNVAGFHRIDVRVVGDHICVVVINNHPLVGTLHPFFGMNCQVTVANEDLGRGQRQICKSISHLFIFLKEFWGHALSSDFGNNLPPMANFYHTTSREHG
jgi:hypothetical protein